MGVQEDGGALLAEPQQQIADVAAPNRVDAVGDRYDTFEGDLSTAVLADARELAAERFATDEWNRKL